jgi:hypothetical protein
VPPPAPDKELLARIEDLPDHTWMKLPAIKTAGELKWPMANNDYRRRGPMVRDYCNRMVSAPERQRALYCGAGHNVHPFNDVWEYDLASNTWICLYAPDPAPRSMVASRGTRCRSDHPPNRQLPRSGPQCHGAL